ncbi:protein FAM240C [Pangasianodon hypophthalmus]|uniref:protein FAM240C n=1 Tax=Pangasianodon hypophthalmus TaxID=310915 RepID=UPI000F0038CF|nr:protein FAM240C [Pangasianodon hypophthalmus]
MNLARIHDKQKLKKFWEQKIERHHQMTGKEEARMKRSALSKLRKEWIQRLLIRSHGVNGNMSGEEMKKD